MQKIEESLALLRANPGAIPEDVGDHIEANLSEYHEGLLKHLTPANLALIEATKAFESFKQSLDSLKDILEQADLIINNVQKEEKK